jgi:hypothetical protein
MSAPEYVGGPMCGKPVPMHLLAQERVIAETPRRDGVVTLHAYFRQGGEYVHGGSYAERRP